MNYTKQQNKEFALKLLLMWALKVNGDRVENKMLTKIIKLLEDKQ